MGSFPEVDMWEMVGYALVVAVPSVIILAVCTSRKIAPERRNDALLVAPLLVFVFAGGALAMLLPCVNPRASEGTGGAAALVVFSGYAWLELARFGKGWRKYLGIILVVMHVCAAIAMVACGFGA